ncbi:hypothetical protein G6N82_13110 [Altererythrobacter sp. BO-6]|uniref:hypothetical protein n=1 Tax=Altererythrobacter sp. BO-6 TaxID=2604537 RepID=UPI0013E13D62|nr:hypothetical protein [Altererythrobacter sp. BO-6]QIG54961.1 hypothetical protein G6N82_13110 [Altererythrobacter sp. BO-6]
MESRFGSRRKRASLRPILGAAAASFVLGAAAVAYFLWPIGGESDAPAQLASDVAAPLEGTGPAVDPAASPSPTPSASETQAAEVAAGAAQAVERVAEQQGGLDQRLAAAEQRLARLDLQAQAAAGNAARAEGLLIAFATRRAIERGAELGYLADQLRLRFGDSWPNAVRTIITFSRDPITLDVLLARLEGLAPELRENDGINSWADFRRELGQLFVIRRESTPSPQPERRLERARQFLESGRVDAAIAEVQNLPGAEKAETWIADAQRYGAAMEALETIETAAVLDPGRLRDGAGNPVEQRSPVGAPGQ